MLDFFFQLWYDLFGLKKILCLFFVGKIAICHSNSKCIYLQHDFRPILEVTEHWKNTFSQNDQIQMG